MRGRLVRRNNIHNYDSACAVMWRIQGLSLRKFD